MAQRGKRYREAARRYDRLAAYAPTEGLGLVKSFSKAGFDETVDAVFKLGIDPRKADQLVR
ncbi:MAG: 50S ribosomal protein L1, partial [Actinobacteria bacterium]|nr:50S ribosomal protein L1 [Actinomycetota bacterium]NIY08244.1 50S ribosomal protein L1 [Gemmatimonadota bacterium]NIS30350.1 50S ribosomal protein L1 [Actinomycetota bacterium]NIT95000.1 50S ribosomal protein L1 [Actinomycetota bacterium]NIU18682.1 50S ribosomal protein L1 [Actinomycetota bacterium]